MTRIQSRQYEVSGLHCASCARSVEKGLASLDGVETCQLDFTSARLRLEGSIDSDEVMERIRALGYGARPLGPDGSPDSGMTSAPEEQEEGTPSYFRYLARNRQTWPALAGAVLLLPGLIFHEILHWEVLWIEIPALLALVLAGAPVVWSGWRGLRINREFNIQALITIAVAGALVIGAWVEAGMVVVLFALGESLEGYVAVRARSAIRGLAATAPDVATRIRRGEDEEGSVETVVPVGDLVPGDTILVRPGERIPMDGAVVSGRSTVDQAALTGESIPL